MTLIRLIILALVAYLLIRLLRSLKRESSPKVRRGRARREKSPFEGADIEDVSFKDVSPEEDREHRDS